MSLCTPTVMRSTPRTPETSMRPTVRSRSRIRNAERARTLGVAVPLEEQQQRVATELDQAAAVVVGDPQQGAEHAVDRVDQQFGALAGRGAAARSESFVKPDRSANSIEPGTDRTGENGSVAR